MARDFPQEVRRGLQLQSLGNEIIRLCGGRSVHPVGVCVGGFHHAPAVQEVARLRERLQSAVTDARALVAWTASLELPDNPQHFTSVALRHDREYPMNEGRLVSDSGLDIAIDEFADRITEYQVPHSTAFHALLDNQPYLAGPLARVNLNRDRMPPPVTEIMGDIGIEFPSSNMFHSIVARAIEIYFAFLEAMRILEDYEVPASPYVSVSPRRGIGYGCTEAPRGLLWHRYELNETGDVVKATIVPPTSQNQARIEQDLHESLQDYGLDRSDDEIRLFSEKIIRNYDPCISCSTHFLKVDIHRE
jgi:sulfhydrogenase subunit alpha